MATFAVELEYGDRDLLQRIRPTHREYLRELEQRGVLLAAGPYADDKAGLLIYSVADEDELRKVLDADPYTQHGVVARTTIREWNTVLGTWLS